MKQGGMEIKGKQGGENLKLCAGQVDREKTWEYRRMKAEKKGTENIGRKRNQRKKQ